MKKEELELEHLPKAGKRFETKQSEYEGFCPRCLMTEEEASEKPCFYPDWLLSEIKKAYEAVRDEKEAIRKQIFDEPECNEMCKNQCPLECKCPCHWWRSKRDLILRVLEDQKRREEEYLKNL